MTTLSISLDDVLARKVKARSDEAGQTPEEYAREVLNRVAGLPSLRTMAEQNAERLRTMGYASEEEVARAIQEGIAEARRAR